MFLLCHVEQPVPLLAGLVLTSTRSRGQAELNQHLTAIFQITISCRVPRSDLDIFLVWRCVEVAVLLHLPMGRSIQAVSFAIKLKGGKVGGPEQAMRTSCSQRDFHSWAAIGSLANRSGMSGQPFGASGALDLRRRRPGSPLRSLIAFGVGGLPLAIT